MAFEIYVSFDTAESASVAASLSYTRVSDTGQEKTRTLAMVNTAPKRPREIKTIWQHLKD